MTLNREFGEGEGRACVDLAEHVVLFVRSRLGAVKEVGVPDHRQLLGRERELRPQFRDPLLLKPCTHVRVGRGVRGLEQLSRWPLIAAGWHQTARVLSGEADDMVVAEVCADHPFRKPQLVWLVDHRVLAGEIGHAPLCELGDC